MNNKTFVFSIKRIVAIFLCLAMLLMLVPTSFASAATDNPDFKLVLSKVDNANRKVYVDVVSGEGANIAACAYKLQYNSKHMTCVEVTPASQLSSNIVSYNDKTNGVVSFSYYNTTPISKETTLLTLAFDVASTYYGSTDVTFLSTDAVGYDFNELTLDYHDLNFTTPKLKATIKGTASYTKIFGTEDFNLNLTTTNKDSGAAISYKSSNNKIATVDAAGNVSILAKGNVKITATTKETENYQASSKTISIKVTADPFKDVNESDWFYRPVVWALDNGITTGVSATQFNPTGQCTRGQVVTFLWRAAGEPKPSSSKSPFTDLESGAYYKNAVLWAYENGITTGTSATKFSPNDTVTRGQFVTFLWRLEGEPDATSKNPFKDVKKSQYYYDAVLWAYENGITTGTSQNTFSPNAVCLRQEVVTFLYRNFV